jgi:hypothetical protein
MPKTRFYLDRVKSYLDKVLSSEEYLNTFQKVADDIYRVYNYKPRINLQDVDSYLRGLPLSVAYITYETEKLALEFCKSLRKLTNDGRRSADDVYWWALAECIWTYGAMRSENPSYRG